ncbi:MAG TPA: S8 family serine peptidase [Actinomycetota bacterium]|nr:S8 family serine peptidase [Actinomycetota bacterium]
MRNRVARAVVAVALAAGAVVAVPGAGAQASGATETYIVLYRAENVPADARATVERAGGTFVYAYDQIGVVIARSDSATFRSQLLRDNRVEGAAATTNFGVQVDGGATDAEGPPQGDLPNAPATDADTFSPLQWDMRQIHAPEAHAITGGSPAVVVGNIDTGLDKDHPDLVQNIDFSNSASCESGAPDQDPAAWDDRHGHGTHTGGTIAAGSNGFGIVGTAPNVKLAGIKASTDEGFFFPEMVVCAFMWAGTRHLDVTNNSYFADPFLFNCHNDPVQQAIWKAESRAIRYAQTQGVTVVASAGNNSDDLSHPALDVTSPDFPPGSEIEREVTNACVVIPVEVPGVIGVSANGNTQQNDDNPDEPDYLKSFYSNYGVSAVEVTAPGGDSIFGVTPESPNGRVLSTWPHEIFCRPDRRLEDASPLGPSAYCYAQGTSMAGPHVAGVAALIVSVYGDLENPQNGKMRPGAVSAFITQTADPQPCPTTLPPGYEAFTQVSGEPQECDGGPGHNSWYGTGRVDALRAITHTSQN